jgi:hypothetical protein
MAEPKDISSGKNRAMRGVRRNACPVEVIPLALAPGLFGISTHRIENPQAEPRHVVIGEDLTGPSPHVFVHTAGRDVVWTAPIVEVVKNRRFIRGLGDPCKAMRLGYSAGMICAEQSRGVRQEIGGES